MSVGVVNKQTGERIPTAGMPAIDSVLSGSSTNPVQNRVVKAALDEKADTDLVASDFDATASYTAGNYCIYEGKFYKFKASHSGAWAAADVDSITVTGELKGKQDIFERISYADWQLLSQQQQAAKPYYIYDYPSTAITAANVSYDHTQSGLSATTAQGGIDELASEKQDATDNNLTTTNKTIVGGINEVKSGLNNLNNKFSSVTIEGITETNGVLTPVTSISASDYIVLSCVASNSNIAIPFVAGSDGTIRFMVVNTNLQPLNGVAVTVVANLMLIS